MAEIVRAEEVGEQVLAVCGGGDTLVEFCLGEHNVLCLWRARWMMIVPLRCFGNVVRL